MYFNVNLSLSEMLTQIKLKNIQAENKYSIKNEINLISILLIGHMNKKNDSMNIKNTCNCLMIQWFCAEHTLHVYK